eukprot:2145937-Karenia_brevis.AAC.1
MKNPGMVASSHGFRSFCQRVPLDLNSCRHRDVLAMGTNCAFERILQGFYRTHPVPMTIWMPCRQ